MCDCSTGGGGRSFRAIAILCLDLFGETLEEKPGHLFCCGVDQSAAELRQLAADIGVHRVVQDGFIAILFKPDDRASLGEAGDAALTFARDPIAVRRIEVRQRDCALEFRGDRDPP